MVAAARVKSTGGAKSFATSLAGGVYVLPLTQRCGAALQGRMLPSPASHMFGCAPPLQTMVSRPFQSTSRCAARLRSVAKPLTCMARGLLRRRLRRTCPGPADRCPCACPVQIVAPAHAGAGVGIGAYHRRGQRKGRLGEVDDLHACRDCSGAHGPPCGRTGP